MPNFNIIRISEYKNSFRNESIKAQFDLNIDKVKEHFSGNIPIENIDWNIGVITGASGTGKTTIAKEIFKENYIVNYDYTNESVIDNMPKDKSVKEITKIFNSVGFATVWSWLKPFHVLSEGEKMRVNLARAILENKDKIVFDEFTSVVNREVAKHSSFAISKAIRRLNKQFIAVTCHSDIIEWLEPDWIFNTDNMEFKETRGLLRRPKIELVIKQCKRTMWQYFRKYHYLSSEINNSSVNYAGFINDTAAIFCSILHFPHPIVKNYKRVHRVVTLPDYQGLGLGINMLNYLGEFYKNQKQVLNITFTTQALVNSFLKSDKWTLFKPSRKHFHTGLISKNNYSSSKYTYSCRYL